MSSVGYKLLGMFVWKASKVYASQRVGRYVPSRRLVVASVAGVTIVGVAASALRKSGAASRG